MLVCSYTLLHTSTQIQITLSYLLSVVFPLITLTDAPTISSFASMIVVFFKCALMVTLLTCTRPKVRPSVILAHYELGIDFKRALETVEPNIISRTSIE